MLVRFALVVVLAATPAATLTFCFGARAPDAPPYARGRRFLLTGTAPDDARHFADAVERARGRR